MPENDYSVEFWVALKCYLDDDDLGETCGRGGYNLVL